MNSLPSDTLSISDSDIAIIGMSCRWPGANNSEAFWQRLIDGVEMVSFFSDEELLMAGVAPSVLENPNYVKAGTVLDGVEQFDAAFFGVSAREAEILDPQHRWFLMEAVHALETAGYYSDREKALIGVYAGADANTYLLNNLYGNRDFWNAADKLQVLIGNEKDYLSTRVSYKLNLKGPSVGVQTACSTSLVAVHLACQGLLMGDCDIALAGGVTIHLPQHTGYWYQEGSIFSPDGHCRTFDAKARGTVDGKGLGIVVLKRLADALADGDYIHAVVKGSAINNDGSADKVGYTAPSVRGQSTVITEALAMANVSAETITYVETHGTGTKLGDPIEMAALTQAFRAQTPKIGFCAVGSVKTNMGHAQAAAGVASLIKTVLALEHRLLPPSLHFEQPNPEIDFANSPFVVNTTLSEWNPEQLPRRAGVSSFGMGGTNAHVILEEAPVREPSGPASPWQLLMLSAKTASALEQMTANLAAHLEQHPELNLADVAYTLCRGRPAFSHRRIVVGHHLESAITAIRQLSPTAVVTGRQRDRTWSVVLMFAGQGSQYIRMAEEIYQTEPVFREQVDFGATFLKPQLGLDLRHLLYPREETTATPVLNQTAIAQVALFVIEYALARLWMTWGLQPQAMIGHSIGEYVAACLAGVFSLEEALSLVATRGQLMQSLPSGSMLAVSLSESAIQPWLTQKRSLAAINGPSRCVVAGETPVIESLESQLTAQGIECRRLHTSHAFHSEMMTPILSAFTTRVKQVKLKPPKIPYLSNVTGTWITAEQATNPSYWANQLRQTVRFSDGLQQLLKENSAPIWLEVGPGHSLSTLIRQHLQPTTESVVLSSLRQPQDSQSDRAFLLKTLGKIWLLGGQIDWSAFYAHEHRHRLPLPTYPFEGQRYWVAPSPWSESSVQVATTLQQLGPAVAPVELVNATPVQTPLRAGLASQTYVAPRNEVERKIAQVWQQQLGIEPIGVHDNFFELGGDSLIALPLLIQLREVFQTAWSLQSLLQAPTIAQLAQLISGARAAVNLSTQSSAPEVSSSLVAIRSTGANRPLFCVHPIGGNALCYAKLAQYLGDEQPVYGLLAKGLDGQEAPLTDIKEMATEYLKVLQIAQPKGSYLLIGWSFGGVVAFEMALQLQQQGEEVTLFVIDIGAPMSGLKIGHIEDTVLLALFATDLGIWAHQEITALLEILRGLESLDQQLHYLLTQAKHAQVLPATANIQDIQPLIQVFKANFRALQNYVPKGQLKQITLFRAEDLMFSRGSGLFDIVLIDSLVPHAGWNQFALEIVAVYTIPGNHYTSMVDPQVEQWAVQLKRCLKI